MTFRSGGHYRLHRGSEDSYRPSSYGPEPEALTFEGCGKREEKIVKIECGRLYRLYFCLYMYHIIWKLLASSLSPL